MMCNAVLSRKLTAYEGSALGYSRLVPNQSSSLPYEGAGQSLRSTQFCWSSRRPCISLSSGLFHLAGISFLCLSQFPIHCSRVSLSFLDYSSQCLPAHTHVQ